MINLVTGFRNEPHITPDDDRSFNASIFGAGKYVLNRGSKFEYEIISNNLIKIKDGDAINQGAHMRIEKNSYEEVTIDNGSQSLNRTDLIVLRYEKNLETKIETASIVVIKGTEAESPVMPEHETGNLFDGDYMDDMPLYAVKLEGINITSVEPLFSVAKNLPGLEEELKQTNDKFSNLNIIKNGYFLNPLKSQNKSLLDSDEQDRIFDCWDCNNLSTISFSEGLSFAGKKIVVTSVEQLSACLYQKIQNMSNDEYTLSFDVSNIENHCDVQIVILKTTMGTIAGEEETLTFNPQIGKNVFHFEGKPTKIKINSYTSDNVIGKIKMSYIKLEIGLEATPCTCNVDLATDSGWIYPVLNAPFEDFDSTDRIKYRKKGNVVELRFRFKASSTVSGSSDNVKMFSLREEFAPTGSVYILCRGYSNRIFGILIENDGSVYFTKYMAPGNTSYVNFTTTDWGAVHVTYLVD